MGQNLFQALGGVDHDQVRDLDPGATGHAQGQEDAVDPVLDTGGHDLGIGQGQDTGQSHVDLGHHPEKGDPRLSKFGFRLQCWMSFV